MLNNFKPIFDAILAGLALVVPLTLSLSICYELGFYRALAISFTDLPISWTDLLRLAIAWLPQSLVMVSIGWVAALYFDRVEKGESEQEIMSKLGPKMRFFRKYGNSLPFLTLGLFAIVWLLFGDAFFFLGGIYIAFAWLLFVEWLQKNEVIRSRYLHATWRAIAFAPAILILIHFQGFYTAAIGDFDQVEIVFKDSNKAIAGDVKIVRQLESVVVLVSNKSTVLVSASEISIIKRTRMQYKYIGFVGYLKNLVGSTQALPSPTRNP